MTTEDGSGLVHIAPAYGADDMQVAIESDLPILSTVAEDGTFISDVRPWAGKFVKDADPYIIRGSGMTGDCYSKMKSIPILTRSVGVATLRCCIMPAHLVYSHQSV